MTSRNAIYKILFDALLELREQGAQIKNAKVFHLADLIHQLPLRLKEMEERKASPAEVLRELRERARSAGIEGWVDRRAGLAKSTEREQRANVTGVTVGSIARRAATTDRAIRIRSTPTIKAKRRTA